MSQAPLPGRLPLTSPDIAAERLARLCEVLPGAIVEGKVVPERLAELVGAAQVSNQPERYGLSYTGNDFVYPDDFRQGVAHYKEQTQQTRTTNPETSGRYHSDWLLAGGSLAICLGRALTPEILRGIIATCPTRVLCLDCGFAGNDELKTNTVLEMQSHGIRFQTL